MFLLESPIAVAAIGAVFVAVAAIYYVQTRSEASLAAVLMTVVLTVVAVAVERWWLTPTEQVRAEIGGLFSAIEANDLQAVLSHIDAQAFEVRGDAEAIMPRFRVERAGEGGEVAVEFSSADAATASLRPLIRVVDKKSGATGAYFDGLELDLVRRGERWLVTDYRPATDWRDGARRLSR